MILDGGVRQKQQPDLLGNSGFAISDKRGLTTYSFTPRLVAQGYLFGLPTKVTTGVDFYDATLNGRARPGLQRSAGPSIRLNHRSVGVYWQQDMAVHANRTCRSAVRGQADRYGAR